MQKIKIHKGNILFDFPKICKWRKINSKNENWFSAPNLSTIFSGPAIYGGEYSDRNPDRKNITSP